METPEKLVRHCGWMINLLELAMRVERSNPDLVDWARVGEDLASVAESVGPDRLQDLHSICKRLDNTTTDAGIEAAVDILKGGE